MKKITRTIDFVIIGLTLVGALFIFGYARPLIIAPLTDLTTTNSSILFAFDKADTILVDDNLEFSHPRIMHAENNLIVSLQPGVYYWKIKGLRESVVHNITILSAIDLRVQSAGDKYELTNAGNVPLSVQVYNNSKLQDTLQLSVSEKGNASGTMFLGRENVSG